VRSFSAWAVLRNWRWIAPARPIPINAAEREIDELAFDILATQQPAAVDLRFILAVTKINADLERVGDQAVNIAERVMDLIELPAVDLPVDIARMATAVSAMVRRALESCV
jgi:phosphate transport system protein